MFNFKLSLANPKGHLKIIKWRIRDTVGYLVVAKPSLELNAVSTTSPRHLQGTALFQPWLNAHRKSTNHIY